jgi:type IV pilus assembly protein PilE
MKLNRCRHKTCEGRAQSSGFTFLELMIVIAVIVLLLGVALPAYQDFVVRSKLQSGTESLSALRGLLTQVYADNRSYRNLDDTACRIATYPTEHFDLDCTATSDKSYLLTATSKASEGLGSAGDYVYLLDSNDIRDTTVFRGAGVDVDDYWKYR